MTGTLEFQKIKTKDALDKIQKQTRLDLVI
jgi:hypothetical protein